MIAKGTTHNNGVKLAAYMTKAKPGERTELWQLRGFASDNIKDAFRSVHVIAAATQCEKPFFHVQVRNPDGEILTREQWGRVANRIETKLGYTGQPRAIAFHRDEKTGHEHMHIAWSRINAASMTAEPLPFFKLRLKEVCRELEVELGLRQVKNHRDTPVLAPTRDEFEQARRLGIDIHQVRATIREFWDRSDNGNSFAAALAAAGLTLAKGEHRDFIVIDREGGMHALGKRILGSTAAEVRARCCDLDREGLPTVEQARQQLATTRAVLRETAMHAGGPAWEDALVKAASDKKRIERRFVEAELLTPAKKLELDAEMTLEALTRNRATFTARDIVWQLREQVGNRQELSEFTAEILSHPNVVRLTGPGSAQPRYTTRKVLETEHQVLRAATALSVATGHEVSERDRATVLAREFHDITVEQSAAIRHATEAEGIALIDGQAGTGKSYTINAIRRAYEQQGRSTVGLAPTNAVAQDMRDEGFAHARTIHSELFALKSGRTQWNSRTVVIVDEAAMIDTRNLSMLTAHAQAAGAKLVLVGDDRQLSSIERGGMFSVLKDTHGAAELTQVRRQQNHGDQQASALMAQGNFRDALTLYDEKGAIHWTRTQAEARAALVDQWARDSAANPTKSRFVFAYCNQDANELNAALRDVRVRRGELGEGRTFQTKHGAAEFASTMAKPPPCRRSKATP